MGLPEAIAVQYTEEDAGYLLMSPVVNQTFRLTELLDMMVRSSGKDVSRVHQILRVGSVTYNGYRYRWNGFEASADELAPLLSAFPDDNPDRAFDPASVTAIILETGGGTQRMLVTLAREEAVKKRLFAARSPWDVLLGAAKEFPLRYEQYDHARGGDRYRAAVPLERAADLLAELRGVAPGRWKRAWRKLLPPSALLFICVRK